MQALYVYRQSGTWNRGKEVPFIKSKMENGAIVSSVENKDAKQR